MAIGEWKIKASVDMASVKQATRDLKGEMKKAGDSIEKNVGDRGTKSVSKLTTAFKGLKSLFFAGGLIGAVITLGNVLKQSFTNFVAFEKGLARINTVANVSKKEMRGLGKEIKTISETYGLAKDELLETGFNISSAGVEFKNVAKIMELSAITAVGAGTDTTTAFNGIIAVIKKYGENINIAGDIAEKFFIANKLGQTTIEDMAIAMQNLTSSVKPAGVSIDEVFTILATFTGVTGNANQVVTQLNGAINALASPTKEARKLFDELGIEVGQAAIKEKGFATVAEDVYNAVDGNTEALRQLIPEVEAQKLIIALATTQNAKYKESLDEVTNGQGNLEEAVRKMSNTTDFKLKVAGKKWENFKTSTGKSLVKIMAWIWDFGQIIVSVSRIIAGFVTNGIMSFGYIGVAIGSFIMDVIQNFDGLIEYFKNFSWSKLIKGELEAPSFNLKNSKKSFDGYIGLMKNMNKGIGDEFDNIKGIITGNSKEQQLAIKETVDGIKNMNQSFGDDTINKLNKRMEELNKQLKDAKIGTDEFKKLTKELKEVEDKLFDAGKEARSLDEIMGDGGETGKVASEKVQKELKKLEKEYKDVEKQIDNNIKAQKKYAEDSAKYNEEIIDDIREQNKLLDDRKAKLSEEITTLEGEGKVALAERFVEIKNEEKDIEAEIKELKKSDDGEKYLKINQLEEDRKKIIKERGFIEGKVDADRLKNAVDYANLSSAEQIEIDTLAKITEKEKEFEAEKEKLEQSIKINQAFLSLKKLDEQQLSEFMETEVFNRFTTEEQALFLKLARDKIALTQQKDEIIAQQQEISDKTIELSMETTAIQKANINELQDEYASLIAQIDSAIAKQRTLNALQGGTIATGFATGGFTGAGGTNEVKGVVHGGEWVAPKWMVNDMQPLFDNLEGARTGGGGNTTTNTKTQNNTINVGGGNFDAQQFLDYAKWKL